MAEVPALDVLKLRASGQKIRLFTEVSPPLADLLIATADINQASFSDNYGQITVDNKSANFDTLVEVGMMFRIYDTSTSAVTMYGVIRLDTSGATVFIDPKSAGSSGYPQAIRNAIADNQRLEVYKIYPVWGEYSRIAGNVFLKRFSVSYTNQGSVPDPIVNIGTHRLLLVNNDTDTIDETFTATVDAWNSSVSTYAWDSDGAAYASGSSSSQSPTLRFSPSQAWYVVRCTVTLASGKSYTAVRYVWCKVDNPESDYAPFSQQYDLQITNDNQDNGREVTFSIGAPLPSGTVYPGMVCIIREDATFPTDDLSDPDLRVNNFFGHIADLDTAQSYGQMTRSLRFLAPHKIAALIPTVDQAIIEKASPARWTEVNALLSNPVGAFYYITRWHSPNLWSLHDFVFEAAIEGLRRGAYSFQQESIAGQLDQTAEIARAKVGSRSDGTLRLVFDPMLQENSYRNALDTKYTIEPIDLLNEIQVPFSLRMAVRYVIAGAFAHNGQTTAVRTRAPGAASEQGVTKVIQEDFSIAPTEGQTRCNQIVGHMFARANNPVPRLTLDLARNLDVFEPTENDWLLLKVPETFAIYECLLQYLASGNLTASTVVEDGIRYIQIRCQVVRVTRRWDFSKGVLKTISLEVEPESFGQPGIKEPIPRGGANAYLPSSNILTPTTFDPVFPLSGGDELGYALVWLESGEFGYSRTFMNTQVTFTSLTSSVTGDVLDADWDYSSPFITSGYVSGALRAYLLTWNGASYRIYRVSDLTTDSPSATLQETFTASENSLASGYIRSDRDTADFAICALVETVSGTPKVRYTRTTDGSTWASLTTLGDASSEDAQWGIVTHGSAQLVPAGNSGTYILYRATTTGGAFSALSPNINSEVLPPIVAHNANGTAYAAQINDESPNIICDFDSTFPADITLGNQFVGGTSSITSGGNPGNCADFVWPAQGFITANIEVIFDNFTEEIRDIIAVSYDMKVTTNAFGTADTYFASSGGSGTFPTSAGFSPNVPQTSWTTHSQSGFSFNIGSVPSDTITFGARYSVAGLAAGNGQIDNITLVTSDVGNKLYRFTTFSGSPARTDITPDTDTVPRSAYRLAASDTDITVIATDDEGFATIYESTNNGTAWTSRGGTNQRGVKRGADVRVRWGNNTLRMSDNGVDYYDRYGNFGTVVGSGTIRGVLVLI